MQGDEPVLDSDRGRERNGLGWAIAVLAATSLSLSFLIATIDEGNQPANVVFVNNEDDPIIASCKPMPDGSRTIVLDVDGNGSFEQTGDTLMVLGDLGDLGDLC